MNLAVTQNSSSYLAMPNVLQSFDTNIDETAIASIRLRQYTDSDEFSFRSSVIVEGSNVFIPEQNFILRFTPTTMEIESQPSEGWPKIFLGFATNDEGVYKIRESLLIDLALTTDSKINSTRFRFALGEKAKFSIYIPELGELPVKFSASQEWVKDNKELAKIFRKLRFIEFVFNTKFAIPAQLSASDLRGIEYLYKGLTEGEFITRESNISLLLPKTKIDWNSPPFTSPGVFPQTEHWYAADFFEGLEDLLGRRLLVGITSIRLEKARYVGQPDTSIYNINPINLVEAKFDVLDHQIFIRYDKYAKKGKKNLQQKLAQFKYQYLRDDPPELLALMDDPLIPDVTAQEANSIAMGWVHYNRLPDGYCPQEPEFDEVKKVWRVPLNLTSLADNNREIGVLVIDARSGVVLEFPQLLEAKKNLPVAKDETQALSEFDQEVLKAARHFMDSHPDLLSRLAK